MASERTLYYFSTDLSNSGVRASGFLKFCATLAPGNSLLKSASYLLHSGNFSTVRDFILTNSATIIQDDSGIPLAYYSQQEMELLSVRPLCRTDRQVPRNVSAVLRRTVQAGAADGFRHRLSLAHARIEFAAVGEGARRRYGDPGDDVIDRTAATTTASQKASPAGADPAVSRGGIFGFWR